MREFRYLFGPVPSRRFGMSLGVDLIPSKICTLDCVFCEVGTTTCLTLSRMEYVPVPDICAELEDWFDLGGKADYVTVTGMGEPTLHSSFGDVLSAIRSHPGVKSALLTNSTLMHLPEVRKAAAAADVVKASLSAWDQASFEAVNRSHPDIRFESVVDGLRKFRSEYSGELWLEVFMVPGLNERPCQVELIAKLARGIRPDKVQINTAVRPTAHCAVPLHEDLMRPLAALFSPPGEIISANCSPSVSSRRVSRDSVLAMLRRRPCTSRDISQAFGLSSEETEKIVGELCEFRALRSEPRAGELYYIGV